ncbi:WD40 repeat domain-containing protein [Streptomyces alboniger]|uniref:WD40 repeat domain-containing protein n=1 Tax=Streptomyces alboniger TaxID=132473 RepID=UPI0006E30B49|nr:WD40 repeat domain-containing protein [Streptomyces alboniger]
MPRGERPLEDDGSELTAFAADLRKLREKAGGPPYRQLARDAHYSSTTLADAAGGRRLPSLPVTLAYVRACGGDATAWEARWHALSARLAADEAADEAPAAGDGERRGPYVGLAAFQQEDAAWFFGREQLTDDLVRRIRERRFLAVFGASGAGKSSLLRAGLLPRLREGPHAEWTTVLFAAGAHPLEECAARLAAVGADSATALRRELAADPRALHLTVLKALADRPPDAELLLVVDQFEEVFTLCADAAERTRFITALLTAAQAANSRTRVVLGVRADFYARCAQYPDLVQALRDAQLLVGPMTTDELRRAISRPAARADCTVEGALLARVIADATGRATVLPLVSHALRETWRRRRGSALTLSGYEAAGGIRHALAQTAEAVHAGLTGEQRRLARTVLLRLVAIGEDADATGRRLPRADLDSLGEDRACVGAVVDALARARLITLDTDTVELTHEALLHAWPRLRHWIDEDRAGLLLHQRLSEAATAWDREGRDPGALYRGTRLAAAEEYSATPEGALSALERDFLAASTSARDRERRAAVRTTRRLRRLTVTLSVLLVIALVAGLIAWDQYRTSESHRREAVAEQRSALSRELAAQASVLLADESDLASLLAVYAYRIRPTAEATTSLLAAASRPLQQRLTGHKGEVGSVAISTDGRTVASGGQDGTVRLWNTATSSARITLEGHEGAVHSVALSPDGRTVVSGGRDGTVRLWDTRTGQQRALLAEHQGMVRSVAFSPDGRTVASGGRNGTVRLWNTVTGELRKPLTGHQGAVLSVAFSPDGGTVAGAGEGGGVRLWNTRTGGTRTALDGHEGAVKSVAFSPDGRTAATAGHDGSVKLWNRTTGEDGLTLTGHGRDVESVAFSPDGRTVVSGGRDGTVRLWDAASGARRAVLSGPGGGVRSVAFSRDGSTIVGGRRDGTVRLWAVATGKARITVSGPRGAVNSVAFSPDGRRVADGGDDGTIRLRDAATGRPRATLDGHEGPVRSVAFGPDGGTVAGAGGDGTVRLWDTASGEQQDVLTGHRGGVLSVAFSPDGRTVAGAGSDGTVRLWDTATGRRRKVLTGHQGGVGSVAFSPDGRILASGGLDGTLRLWDTGTGRARSVRGGGGSPIRSVSFAPAGYTVAGGSDDGIVRLWDAESGRARGELTGVRRGAETVDFSPDGRTVASSGREGTVRLWDASTSMQKAVLPGHAGPVRTVAFSPDGRTVASGGDDGALRLWNVLLSADEAISRICRSLRRDLSPQERARYLHDPYQQSPRRACAR